jgi:5-(carboxyamino)imidazole ribonucleotide mutase
MGSKSDWEIMQTASAVLTEFGVPHESRALSAHRSPDLVAEYAKSAEARGLEVIIAAAGMAAALPGVVAALTPLPVLGVPMEGKLAGGLDALLSMAQMPGGVPVGTLAVGSAGARNAALLAVRILANSRPELRERLRKYHARMAEEIGKDSVL